MDYQFSKYYNSLPEEAKQLYRKKLTLHLDGEKTVVLPDPFAKYGYRLSSGRTTQRSGLTSSLATYTPFLSSQQVSNYRYI